MSIVPSSGCTDNWMETFMCWGCEERIWALLSVGVPAPPVSLQLDKSLGDNAMLMQHSSVLLVFHSAAQ